MKERTYTQKVYAEATKAWNDYGPEWADLKRIAFANGFPFPPDGSRFDDRDDEHPSQRAIIWRALDFRPQDTIHAASRCRSWGQLIGMIIQTEARLAEDAALWESEDRRDTEATTIGHRESVAILAGILQRIDDSR